MAILEHDAFMSDELRRVPLGTDKPSGFFPPRYDRTRPGMENGGHYG